jgi:hypothetical protein
MNLKVKRVIAKISNYSFYLIKKTIKPLIIKHL